MALESTAINDLIAGLQRKPLEGRDSDNWLFGEAEPRDDHTDIDTSREGKSTTPFERRTPPVVPLPKPFQRQPAAAIEYAIHRPSSPTTHVRARDWGRIAKVAALPIGLSCIVIVLLGVYFAKSETKKAAAVDASNVTVTAKAEAIEPPPAPAPAPAPAPSTTIPEPTVTPIDVPKPTVSPIEEPKQEAKAAAPEAPKAAPAETANVEPGSPASRFLAPSAEPTVPTVAANKPTAAPAPTVVPDLPSPPATETLGVEIAAKPAVKAKPAKRTAAQMRADKRAAKRAAKAAAVAKARSKKRVAAASTDDDDDEADDDTAAKPTKAATAKGKGVLAISSTPAMEVWVDGRNSRAETPVRIILLSGKHKVTLLDKDTSKARSFEIEIKPDQVTKVAKSY